MKKLAYIFAAVFIAGLATTSMAQDASVGVSVPVTISGDAIDTQRTKADDADAKALSAGFRVLATPQMKLGSDLYFYSAVEVRSLPYFYADRYSADRSVSIKMPQGYLSYSRSREDGSLSFRAGKLMTAFGAFPLRYDDAVNPMIDQPPAHQYVKLRADQLPCGVENFEVEPEPDVDFDCGGSLEESYGIAPVTLYGLPGAEVNASWHRVDGRLQLTNSSPSNPQGLFSRDAQTQWTAGSGLTIRQGFRIGVSAFHGAWLSSDVVPYLPEGTTVKDYPATGMGIDGQWAHGSWSVNGELQRFVYRYPGFSIDPEFSAGYAEVKKIIGPRWFSAARASYDAHNRPADSEMRADRPFLPNRQTYEIALGFRPNRFQVLKAGYEWERAAGGPQIHANVFAIQLVTAFDAFSKAIR